MAASIKVIIPAFNEQNAVGNVIADIPPHTVQEIIVVDNGSSDDTFEVAEAHGAVALKEHRRGYGQACLTGLHYIAEQSDLPEIIVFLDGDYSDYPEHILDLIQPIIDNQADMVLGTRKHGQRSPGSMTFQQIFGNFLATRLMRYFYRTDYTDLGPFRAIRYSSLMALNMQDRTYGWTIEMQIKAAKLGLRSKEIPIKYRKRIGVSKISGTLSGTLMAGYKIILTIFKYR